MTIRAVDCAKRLNSKMERQFGNDFHCGVSKGPYPRKSWITGYYAQALFMPQGTNWLGTCAVKPYRTVNKHSADLLCDSAYNRCGRNTSCMGIYIQSKIETGRVEMCRKRYNMIVSDARNDISGFTYGGYTANDGHYAKCLFYCAA